MKKTLFVFLMILLICPLIRAQDTMYKSDKGTAGFFSKAPLENIEAVSDRITALLNTETGEVAVLIPIKSFQFDNGLMQDHFNENYMESDKYPNASFKGKLLDSCIARPGTVQHMEVEGELSIHGVTVKRTIPARIKYNSDGSFQVASTFVVALVDHQITIPKLMYKNIAEKVDVSLDLLLIPKK